MTSPLSIAHTTFAWNIAGGMGGGVRNDGRSTGESPIVVSHSLFLNGRYGSIFNPGPAPEIYSEESGSLISLGYNQADDNSLGLSGPGDMNEVHYLGAYLGALMANGGPTHTHALLPGSSAIGAGDSHFDGAELPFDQRGEGFPRIQFGHIDVGAYEFDATVVELGLEGSPTAAGTVEGGGNFPLGTSAYIRATPAAGWRFGAWVGSSISDEHNSETFVAMNELRQATGRFVKIWELSVVVQPAQGGIVVGSGTYDDGTKAGLEAVPAFGRRFAGWTGGEVGDPASPFISVLMTSDVVLTARFEETDLDSDGLTDLTEVELGTDYERADTDGDGLTDGEEHSDHGTDPLVADTDGDGFTDYEEVGYGSDPLDSQADADQDGLTDSQEFAAGTHPLLADTDGDGAPDGWEVREGTDPLTARSADLYAYAFEAGDPVVEVGRDRVFQIEYLRRQNVPVTYSVELSTDLVTWRTGQLQEDVEVLGNRWERVTTSYTPPGFAKVGYARVAARP